MNKDKNAENLRFKILDQILNDNNKANIKFNPLTAERF